MKWLGMCAVALGCGSAAAAPAPPTARGPLTTYLMPRAAEIALARSAAPASISADATILVLGRRGFETAAEGTNGFVCLVERSWFAGPSDPDFWEADVRGPDCFDPAAARSVVPAFLQRARWVMAGATRAEIAKRTRASALARAAPATGAMSLMMSKDQVLSGGAGHWRPHLMFYLPKTPAAAWGANRKGSPVVGGPDKDEPVTVFVVPVRNWSDETADTATH